MKNGSEFIIALVMVSIMVCAVIGYGVVSSITTEQVDPSPPGGNYVRMTQPCRFIWCSGRNYADSQTNLNNSQANDNNAAARLKDAKSTQTAAQIELDKQKQAQDYMNTPMGAIQTIFTNILCAIIALIGLVVVVVVGYALVGGN